MRDGFLLSPPRTEFIAVNLVLLLAVVCTAKPEQEDGKFPQRENHPPCQLHLTERCAVFDSLGHAWQLPDCDNQAREAERPSNDQSWHRTKELEERDDKVFHGGRLVLELEVVMSVGLWTS